MHKTECKVGDVVELNSGGPPMTVLWLGTRSAQCTWMDDNRPQQSFFAYECLKKYERIEFTYKD